MPKRSAEYMESQRLRFCDAATACFRRRGVVATSLSDICEEAGLSMGALYKHFANRDELLEAMLELRLSRRNAALRGPTWAALRTALLKYHEDLEADPFWREFQGVIDWSDTLKELRIREGSVILAQVEQLLDRYVAAGEIAPPFDTRMTAQFISVIFDGALVDVRSAPKLHVRLEDLAAYLDYAVNAQPAVVDRARTHALTG